MSDANMAADVTGETDTLTCGDSKEQEEKRTKHSSLGENEQAPGET